jgi:hypothetical protein
LFSVLAAKNTGLLASLASVLKNVSTPLPYKCTNAYFHAMLINSNWQEDEGQSSQLLFSWTVPTSKRRRRILMWSITVILIVSTVRNIEAINPWNALPQDIINANSTNEFKNRLDKLGGC